MSCVTETLSAALLLRIHRAAEDPLVKSIAHHILRDEIDHSKLGWGHLAAESRQRDVSWLGPHVSSMIRAARAADLDPMTGLRTDTAPYGVLCRSEVRDVIDTTVAMVILPGLIRYGIRATASAA
jgi:hypothetical protein